MTWIFKIGFVTCLSFKSSHYMLYMLLPIHTSSQERGYRVWLWINLTHLRHLIWYLALKHQDSFHCYFSPSSLVLHLLTTWWKVTQNSFTYSAAGADSVKCGRVLWTHGKAEWMTTKARHAHERKQNKLGRGSCICSLLLLLHSDPLLWHSTHTLTQTHVLWLPHPSISMLRMVCIGSAAGFCKHS